MKQPKRSILTKDSYTFSDYFELSHPIEEIVAEFGYSFSLEVLNLPRHHQLNADHLTKLQQTYYRTLPKVSLNSESAKREFFIAPLLIELIQSLDVHVYIEYPIYINDLLRGALDYLIRSTQELVVIEAKKGDLERGFNQLAVELIALDHYEPDSERLLYGAITTGDVWRFGQLHRPEKMIRKDIHTYRLPEDTEILFVILLGILEEK